MAPGGGAAALRAGRAACGQLQPTAAASPPAALLPHRKDPKNAARYVLVPYGPDPYGGCAGVRAPACGPAPVADGAAVCFAGQLPAECAGPRARLTPRPPAARHTPCRRHRAAVRHVLLEQRRPGLRADRLLPAAAGGEGQRAQPAVRGVRAVQRGRRVRPLRVAQPAERCGFQRVLHISASWRRWMGGRAGRLRDGVERRAVFERREGGAQPSSHKQAPTSVRRSGRAAHGASAEAPRPAPPTSSAADQVSLGGWGAGGGDRPCKPDQAERYFHCCVD